MASGCLGCEIGAGAGSLKIYGNRAGSAVFLRHVTSSTDFLQAACKKHQASIIVPYGRFGLLVPQKWRGSHIFGLFLSRFHV